MSSWTFADGAFVQGAQVPVTDRGFRYGMTVFETVAIYRGAVLFAKEHLQRLRAACLTGGFIFPDTLSEEAIEALEFQPEDGVLRLYVSAGDGGPTQPVTASRTYALYEKADFPNEDEIARGWRIGLSRAPFPTILGGWKTGNYWPNIQALQEARREGFSETVISNAQGAVISASMGNLFFVMKDGRRLTPARSMGARDGVLRSWVMEQESTEETLFSVDDLESVEECFVTNSRIGIMPVAAIAEKTLSTFETGRRLARLYRERILRTR